VSEHTERLAGKNKEREAGATQLDRQREAGWLASRADRERERERERERLVSQSVSQRERERERERLSVCEQASKHQPTHPPPSPHALTD
jgi:hypothetical protein